MIVTFGDVMMRLCPPAYARFGQTSNLVVTYGGGEANVSTSLAAMGMPAKHVTCFPDNDLGRAAAHSLRKVGVDINDIVYQEGRLGLYFVEMGAAMRPTKVVYDRADSAFYNLKPEDFDWEEILKDAQWFHFTGITPAISESAATACLQAAQTANRLGITVSADVNYRSNLWRYGKTAKEVMPDLVACCDVIVCGKGDASDIFDILPKEDEKSGFKSICKQIQERFPRVKKIMNTKRGQVSASYNTLTGQLWNGFETLKTETIDITHIVDRIGGGDAFLAGYIYGWLTYKDDLKALNFAVAASCLKHTIEGDYNLATVAEIEAVVNGDVSGRLKR